MSVMRAVVLSALLGLLQQEGDPRALVELLESDDPALRDRAVSELKKLGERARPALEKSPSPHARDLLAWLDWEPLVPDAMRREDPALIEKLAGSGSRHRVVVEERLIPPAAIPRLLLDPDPWISRAAVHKYLQVDDRVQTAIPWSRRSFDAALELLRRWPKHACDLSCRLTHPLWLRETRNLLRLQADVRDREAIRGLLRSESLEVRISGACLLKDDGAAAEEDLLALLPKAGEFRRDILQALHGTTSARAVPVLAPFLAVEERDLRESAIGLLANIGGPEVARLLLEEIRSPRRAEWDLLEGLVRLGVREAVGPMLERLGGNRPEQPFLIRAILRLAGEEGVDRVFEKLLPKGASDVGMQTLNLEGLPPVLDPGRGRRLLAFCSGEGGRGELAQQLLSLVPQEPLQPLLREILARSRDEALLQAALRYGNDSSAAKEWAGRAIREEGHPLFWEAARILEKHPRAEPAVLARVAREKRGYGFLEAFASEGDVGALVRMLEDQENPHATGSILIALWKWGGAAGRAAVLKNLEHPDSRRRRCAFDVLLEFEPSEGRRRLEKWLTDPGHSVEDWEAREYSDRFEAGATPLLRLLWDRDLPEAVRDELERHFLLHGTPESATDVLHVLQSQGQDWALRVLLDWGDGEAEQVLEARLRDGSATLGLFEVGMQRGLASCRLAAEQWLRDPDPRSVAAGLGAMTRLAWCPDVPAVLRIARTETPTLRRAAVRVLRAVRAREAAPLFRDILADSFHDFVLAGEAALGLERLGERDWRAGVERFLDVPKLDWRAAALLDFVDGAEAFTAVPFERNPVVMHGTLVVSAGKLREWTGREVVLTEAAREIVKDGMDDSFEISMPGVLENFIWDKPLGAYWSGGKIVVCSGEEAVARRRALR